MSSPIGVICIRTRIIVVTCTDTSTYVLHQVATQESSVLAEKRAKKRNMINTKILLNVTLALLVSGFLLLAGLGLTTSRPDQQQQQQQQLHPLSDSNHVYIPSLGYGTWNLDRSNASEAVSLAIQRGYRHIDCAAAYGNQKEVGVGIADGIQKAGIKRYDLWVTSKLWNNRYVSGKNLSLQIRMDRSN